MGPDLDPLVDELWGMNHLIVAAVCTLGIPYSTALVILHCNNQLDLSIFIQGTKDYDFDI